MRLSLSVNLQKDAASMHSGREGSEKHGDSTALAAGRRAMAKINAKHPRRKVIIALVE